MTFLASVPGGLSPAVESSCKENQTRQLFFRNGARLIRLTLLLRKLLLRDKVQVISNKDEALEAQKILYREYSARDLCAENPAKLYFNAFSFLSTTRTFVSRRRAQVVATVTVIGDGVIGLPADTLFGKELEDFRKSGMRLIEVGALALDQRCFSKKSFSFGSITKFSRLFTLFSGITNYIHQYTDATHIVIMINPKHRFIYDCWGFVQFAETRHYPHVNKPAVPMILDLKQFMNAGRRHLPAKFVVKTFGLLRPTRSFRYTEREILARAELFPEFIQSLSTSQFEALIEEFPKAQETLSSIRQTDDRSVANAALRNARVRVYSTCFSVSEMAKLDAEYLRSGPKRRRDSKPKSKLRAAMRFA